MNVSSVLNQPSGSQAVEPLNVADRCDLCGARAYMRAVLMNRPRMFCAHHGKAKLEALRAPALRIDYVTDELD